MDDAFELLFRRHYARLVAYFVRQFHFSDEQARELAQDVFLETFQDMEKKGVTPGWLSLKTAAHNVAVNTIRHRSIHRKSETAPIVEFDTAGNIFTEHQPSAEDTTLAKEESIILRAAIESLPPNLRQTLQLQLSGLTYAEIATTLRISASSVRARLHEAKAVLRKTAAAALSEHIRFDDAEFRQLMTPTSEDSDTGSEATELTAEIAALEMLKLRLAGVAAQVRRLNSQFDNYSSLLARHWDVIVNHTAKHVDALEGPKP